MYLGCQFSVSRVENTLVENTHGVAAWHPGVSKDLQELSDGVTKVTWGILFVYGWCA